jgi:hypothetical protein
MLKSGRLNVKVHVPLFLSSHTGTICPALRPKILIHTNIRHTTATRIQVRASLGPVTCLCYEPLP